MYSLTNWLACHPTPTDLQKSTYIPCSLFHINQILAGHWYSNLHNTLLYKLATKASEAGICNPSSFIKILNRSCSKNIMENKVKYVEGGAVGRRSPRGTRPIPKRGQIKSRIAATAFHSIVSVLSKASPNHHHFHWKTYLREA